MSAEIKTLHVPFREWLDTTQAGRIAYAYHRPDKPTGGTKGDADFILYAQNRCLHLEMKDKDTAISTNQRQRHNELAKVGITVHVVRDLRVAVEMATAWRDTIGEAVYEGTPRGRLAIRQRDTQGDWVVEVGLCPSLESRYWIRRATIVDYQAYPRA